MGSLVVPAVAERKNEYQLAFQIRKLTSKAVKWFSFAIKMLDRQYERRVKMLLIMMPFILLTLSGETCSKCKGNSAVHLMPNASKNLYQFHSWY